MTRSAPAPASASVKALAAFLLIGIACALLLAATVLITAAPIRHNRALQAAGAMLELTGATAPPSTGSWHNDIWATCDGLVLIRGRADGYGGPIRWMLAAASGVDDRTNGEQARAADHPPYYPTWVRRLLVTEHHETPGITDFLNDPDREWLARFSGRATDVAALDAVSGATITSRALTRSVAAAVARPFARPAECAQ